MAPGCRPSSGEAENRFQDGHIWVGYLYPSRRYPSTYDGMGKDDQQVPHQTLPETLSSSLKKLQASSFELVEVESVVVTDRPASSSQVPILLLKICRSMISQDAPSPYSTLPVHPFSLIRKTMYRYPHPNKQTRNVTDQFPKPRSHPPECAPNPNPGPTYCERIRSLGGKSDHLMIHLSIGRPNKDSEKKKGRRYRLRVVSCRVMSWERVQRIANKAQSN